MTSPRTLNVGLIGGGGGAFFAHPHQKAIHFDGTRRVVAAALRSRPEAAIEDAANWAYPIKGYASFDEMIDAQKDLPETERLDYVVVVTPNHAHFKPSLKAIRAGIPVFCEKPLTLNHAEAKELASAVEKSKVPFAVAHTYLGHWSTRLARHIVRSGLIGDVRWVDSAYIQGWLAGKTEETGVQQAEWRTDPKKSGASNCGGDIGTHALMQLRYITGLEIAKLSARLEVFVEGRSLDDHFTSYCELSNGAKALVRASQICIGHKNDMSIEVNGSLGTLVWRQEDAEAVKVMLPGQPDRVYWRGEVAANDGFLGDLPDDLMGQPKLPSGHVEGFHDALARLHRDFEVDVRAYLAGEAFTCDGSKYANVEDGRIGLAFIEAAVASSAQDGGWAELD
ncbi:Gfo/Idh/MocA family oxidoreductase [Coraliomargarita algicola]|uniref:Gfo/Idh/MocA family oxidoreductase n=1 Tax=Coraliomargarita algicola TaxID=3092156 RepID=A0ABZ0RJ40_9BACT|nr:Gfo/Idh/MocA family oxidoreductase [Coraliomargarita sp. J2-16]WPJ96221.1 Gfo/Idh/MocA family oxidoreductase [Coraliomargarita sp. J2-16]